MRIAFVSDIHGNLPALLAVVSDFKALDVDQVVNLGDSLSGPLLPLETAHYLMMQNWLQLAGNHERQVCALKDATRRAQADYSDQFTYDRLGEPELAWLAGLRPVLQMSEDVLLCHGTPQSDYVYLLETVDAEGSRPATSDEIKSRLGDIPAATQLIACGHTHMPRVVQLDCGLLLFNPGSVGRQAFDSRHGVFHVMETGSPEARYAIAERNNGKWRVELRKVAYDWESMAQLAESNERPNWAFQLRHGRARQAA